MIRTVAGLLILSLLTLNMAWAKDACAFRDPPGSGIGVAQPHDPAPANTPRTIPTCNHWCPGWMHLVTLPGASVPLPELGPAGFDGRAGADPYLFLPAPPPTHPPTA